MKKKILVVILGILTVAAIGFTGLHLAKAEKPNDSTPESGATSHIKAIYDSVVALGHGSVAAGAWGDWGAYWNRIRSAAEWIPDGTVTTTDVKNGVTFFDGNRAQQTGTYPNPTNCSTQQWYDGHASATAQNNCNLTWTAAAPVVAGDDNRVGGGNKDPRTGLIWSQLLLNNAGTVEFSAASNSTWSWDGTTDADNIAVGGKTASQLCSERGNGWRLPTEKELMQAYIDGSYWNLTQPSNNFWSATENSAATAYYVSLNSGSTNNATKTTSVQVRCVR